MNFVSKPLKIMKQYIQQNVPKMNVDSRNLAETVVTFLT